MKTRAPGRRVPKRRASRASAKDAEAAALARLAEWADASSTAAYDEHLHGVVGGFLTRCAAREATALDPFQISLA